MNPFSLKHKTILITGASSGIGAQTAISASKMGATLVISGRNKARLDKVYQQLEGQNHQVISADLTQDQDLKNLIANCPELDGFVQSSGIVRPFPVKFIAQKQVDEMFDINYKAPVLLIGGLFKAKRIKPKASLVFMSSISSYYVHKGGALYVGSKAAINAYSKTIALEYGHKKIRSNVILAAMVKTPIFNHAEQAVSKEKMDEHGARYPLGFGEPEDVAHGIIFLLSDAAKWVTGTELVMDGGLTTGS